MSKVRFGGQSNPAEVIRELSLDSLYFFARHVLGMEDMTPELHLPFANFLQMHPWNGGPPESFKKMAWMPRGHFKSSLASVALPLWLLCHDRNLTVALFSAKLDNPKKWLRQISNIITDNKIFRAAFPYIRPAVARTRPGYEKWDATEIVVTREPRLSGDAQASISACSIQAGQASQHWDYIVIDDPVNEDTAKSELEVESAVETYKYMDSLGRGWGKTGQLLVGTPYGRADVMEWAFENQVKKGIRLYWGIGALGEFQISPALKDMALLQVTLPEGLPIFPKKCPQEMLDQLQAEDVEKYYLQYLCKPYDIGRNGFDLDLIQSFSEDEAATIRCDCHPRHNHSLANMSVIGLCDPAYSMAKDACKSAVIVCAKAVCGCRFLLEEWAERAEPSTTVEKIASVAQKYAPYLRNFGIETVGFQLVLKSWLEQMQAEAKLPPGVKFHALKPQGRQKDARIRSQQTPVANGFWHKRPMMRYVDGKENFMWELAKWPLSRQRDRIDAGFGYCDDIWALPEATPGYTYTYSELRQDENDEFDRLFSRLSRNI